MGKKQVRYSEEVADEICTRLSNGESLRRICEDDHMPDRNSVFSWIARYEDFSAKYARAREAQAEFLVDEMIAIADDATNDYMETVDSEGAVGYKLNGEHVQRSKLRLETRRWIAEKLRPKKYGAKLELAGDAEAPLQVVIQKFTDK